VSPHGLRRAPPRQVRKRHFSPPLSLHAPLGVLSLRRKNPPAAERRGGRGGRRGSETGSEFHVPAAAGVDPDLIGFRRGAPARTMKESPAAAKAENEKENFTKLSLLIFYLKLLVPLIFKLCLIIHLTQNINSNIENYISHDLKFFSDKMNPNKIYNIF
jgi:hypothetical protein